MIDMYPCECIVSNVITWCMYILQTVYHDKIKYTSFTSHDGHFVLVRTLKICSFSNFRVHNTVTSVTTLCIRSLERSHLLTESSTTRSPCPPDPGSHHAILPASVSSPLLEPRARELVQDYLSDSFHFAPWVGIGSTGSLARWGDVPPVLCCVVVNIVTCVYPEISVRWVHPWGLCFLLPGTRTPST